MSGIDARCMREAACVCYLVCTRNRRKSRLDQGDRPKNGGQETPPRDQATVNAPQAEEG